MKGLTAGTHVQELMSFSKPVVNYAAKMFKMQGGGVKLGSRSKELGVEEEAILKTGYWRDLYSDLISFLGIYQSDPFLKNFEFSISIPLSSLA